MRHGGRRALPKTVYPILPCPNPTDARKLKAVPCCWSEAITLVILGKVTIPAIMLKNVTP
jgi:hypothetical protein